MNIEQFKLEHLKMGFLDLINQFRPAVSKDEVALVINERFRRENITFVMVENEKVVGTATITLERKFINKGGRVAHIEDVIIDSGIRGKGWGKILMNHLFEYAKENKCYKVILNCGVDVMPFYQKLQMTPVGIEMEIRWQE